MYTLRRSEGTYIKSISEFTAILTELRNLDVKLEEENQAMLLLVSLLPSYNNFRDTVMYERDHISL